MAWDEDQGIEQVKLLGLNVAFGCFLQATWFSFYKAKMYRLPELINVLSLQS